MASAAAYRGPPVSRLAAASIERDGSIPATSAAPLSTAARPATPVPVPTSSTRFPAEIGVISTRSAAGTAVLGACTRA